MNGLIDLLNFFGLKRLAINQENLRRLDELGRILVNPLPLDTEFLKRPHPLNRIFRVGRPDCPGFPELRQIVHATAEAELV